MEDGPLVFTVFTLKDGSFSHHLEVGSFPSDFILPSVPSPFFRAEEELGRSKEVVYVFKNEIVDFTCVVFQIQGDCAYLLGLDDPTDALDVCIFSLI